MADEWPGTPVTSSGRLYVSPGKPAPPQWPGTPLKAPDQTGAPEGPIQGAAPVPGETPVPEWPGTPVKPEGALKTFGREAAHGVVPAAGGIMAGAGAGALLGSVWPGPGTIIGGIGGGIAGAFGADWLQDKTLKAVGYDDDAQRAANRGENPWSSFGGQMAPALATARFDRAAPVATRALSGGIFGGVEAGSELYNEGKISPGKVVAATTAGAVLPGQNRIGRALHGAGTSTATAGATAAKNAFGVIEKLVSPETVDANAAKGAEWLRMSSGKAARDTEQTAAAIEPSWKKINSMPRQDQLNFLDYVETRSKQPAPVMDKQAEDFINTLTRGMSKSEKLETRNEYMRGAAANPLRQKPYVNDPALQSLADTLRTQFDKRMAKIAALPSHQQMAFVTDYFPHFWKDPAAAQQALQKGGGFSKQGSGASLKARTVPTIADGIAMGLEPITTNPLEATMRYVTSMDRYIASIEILDTAKNAGQIRYITPKVMGASGHPNSFKVPPGWKPLEGRGATNAAGQQAYAPEGFARVYNNYISRGIGQFGEEYQQGYDAVRRATNAITGLELALSGYHFLTVSKAALDNSMANAINLLRSGKPIEAAKQLAKTPLAPFSYARSGKEIKDVYLGTSPGSRQVQDVVDKLTRAGGRAVGKSPDYEFSKGGSFYTALKRGALKIQFAADRAEARSANIRSFGEARFAAKQIGRIMDTVAAPLFEQYIPAVKNGAFRENLATWLKNHPGASDSETMNAARQIWDTIDDRFGEMVQDNMFMNKFGKQLGMLMLRSWSWTVGQDFRMLGGAVRDFARAPFKRPTGTGPNDTRWTQKMDQAIAMPIVYGTIAAIYQTLKTGQPPESIQDLVAPRTGGTDAATGQPERLLLPGPEKDIYGFAEHPVREGINKLGTGPRQVAQLAMNEDWRGDPILPGQAEDAPPWLLAFAKYLAQDFVPISVRSIGQGRKEGSNLNVVEQMLGVRNAPRGLTDPEGLDDLMKRIDTKKWKDKERHDRRQQQLYEGG